MKSLALCPLRRALPLLLSSATGFNAAAAFALRPVHRGRHSKQSGLEGIDAAAKTPEEGEGKAATRSDAETTIFGVEAYALDGETTACALDSAPTDFDRSKATALERDRATALLRDEATAFEGGKQATAGDSSEAPRSDDAIAVSPRDRDTQRQIDQVDLSAADLDDITGRLSKLKLDESSNPDPRMVDLLAGVLRHVGKAVACMAKNKVARARTRRVEMLSKSGDERPRGMCQGGLGEGQGEEGEAELGGDHEQVKETSRPFLRSQKNEDEDMCTICHGTRRDGLLLLPTWPCTCENYFCEACLRMQAQKSMQSNAKRNAKQDHTPKCTFCSRPFVQLARLVSAKATSQDQSDAATQTVTTIMQCP